FFYWCYVKRKHKRIFADDGKACMSSDDFFIQQAKKLVTAVDGRIVKVYDHIPFFNSCRIGRRIFLYRQNKNAPPVSQVMEINYTGVKVYILHADSQKCLAYASLTNEHIGDGFCGVDADGETQPLCLHDGSSINTNYFGCGVNERPARISGVQR